MFIFLPKTTKSSSVGLYLQIMTSLTSRKFKTTLFYLSLSLQNVSHRLYPDFSGSDFWPLHGMIPSISMRTNCMSNT